MRSQGANVPIAADLKAFSGPSEYAIRVGDQLRTLAGQSIFDLAAGARGVLPSELPSYLAALGAPSRPLGDPGAGESLPGPELHAAEFEWYFCQETRRSLADLVPGSALLIGAPTLATELRAASRAADLIDRSPFLDRRFPGANLRWHRHDLARPLRLLRTHRFAFFDAPWHEDHVRRWLWQASLAVSRGGTLAFALFPELTRPAAAGERQRLLELSSQLGRVELIEGALRYETPRFEREALGRAGVPISGPWRRGDVVLIHNLCGSIKPQRPAAEIRWKTVVQGERVLKLQDRARPIDSNRGLRPLALVGRARTLRGSFELLTSRQEGVPARF